MHTAPLSYKLILLLGGVSLLSIPFSPIASFAISILTLLTMSKHLIGYFRQCLILLAFISLLIIIASRNYTDELDHDLSHYFMVYKALSSGYYSEIFGFSGGIEVGWPLIYLFISKCTANISPVGLAVINTSICLILLYVWMLKYAFKNELHSQIGIIAALIILFASIQTYGYLQRQAISTVILLFAISTSGKKSFFYLTIATLFHLTSLPIGLLYLFLKRYYSKISLRHIIIIFILLIIIKLNLYFVLNFLSEVGAGLPGVNKLNFYLMTATEFSFTSKRFAILIFPLTIVLMLCWNKINNSYWKIIAIYSCLSYIGFLGVPLGPERINFILLYIYGYFVYMYIYKFYPSLTTYFILIYVLLFIAEKMNFFGNSLDPFWSRYPFFSFEPFYYLY
ncbi:TPA: EpsG family protein [Citrobacter amalonaticus]|uniref:EpsG family protein n=1 Tax=Citrobacter amalonaticus TaxID=35703 RepID=UPI001906D849|nr:EpsG family protein [Citrobacter amalonaticus]MBJ8734610.1 EpsG family protein [Citrobacter amalonaticus]HCD1275299.1 EpsG family protein [Citrobacter amalonaticus]